MAYIRTRSGRKYRGKKRNLKIGNKWHCQKVAWFYDPFVHSVHLFTNTPYPLFYLLFVWLYLETKTIKYFDLFQHIFHSEQVLGSRKCQHSGKAEPMENLDLYNFVSFPLLRVFNFSDHVSLYGTQWYPLIALYILVIK